MLVTVDWDNPEQTILRVSFPEQWNWDEYFEMAAEAGKFFDSVEHRVDAIFDFQETPHVPKGMTSRLSNLAEMPFLSRQNAGLIVFVNSEVIQELLLTTFVAFFNEYRKRFVVADSIEEAYATIADAHQSNQN